MQMQTIELQVIFRASIQDQLAASDVMPGIHYNQQFSFVDGFLRHVFVFMFFVARMGQGAKGIVT